VGRAGSHLQSVFWFEHSVADDTQDKDRKRPAMRRRLREPIAIVGVGASAKSFASLERLFAHLPSKSGVAYVVAVRSEDSVDAQKVVEALGRQSGVPAQLATAGAWIEPDRI
jgi:chemotaxis response regulator CheB